MIRLVIFYVYRYIWTPVQVVTVGFENKIFSSYNYCYIVIIYVNP